MLTPQLDMIFNPPLNFSQVLNLVSLSYMKHILQWKLSLHAITRLHCNNDLDRK